VAVEGVLRVAGLRDRRTNGEKDRSEHAQTHAPILGTQGRRSYRANRGLAVESGRRRARLRNAGLSLEGYLGTVFAKRQRYATA
jgi:hypothetical protein